MKKLSALLLVAVALPAQAAPIGDPFYTADRSPLTLNSGLPGPESARLVPAGQHSVALFGELSTIATHSIKARERFVLDGETTIFEARLRYGAKARWELGVDLRWLHHDGGSLDGFIDDWHDAFHLTGGDRDEQPQDRLLYEYNRDGVDLLQHTEPTSGVGNLRLTAAYQLEGTETAQSALRATVTLPTGDADRLLGSDAAAASLSLVNSRYVRAEEPSFQLHGGIGLLLRGTSEPLPDLQRDWGLHGFLALDWRFRPALHFKAQLSAHSTLYRGDVEELKRHALQLVFGGTAAVGRRWLLDVSLSEDLIGETPDITFQLGLRYVTQAP